MESTDGGMSHKSRGDTHFMLWSMPIIDSGWTVFSSFAEKDKSVSSFTIVVVGTAARSRSGDDNATNNDETIDGSTASNMYGDDVSTAVKFANTSGDRLCRSARTIGQSKAFITSIGTAQSVDGASFASRYSRLTMRMAEKFSTRSGDDDILFRSSVTSDGGDSANKHWPDR